MYRSPCLGREDEAIRHNSSPACARPTHLVDNESYFFAELKRLKLIIDKLNSGEELFIILDEIRKERIDG